MKKTVGVWMLFLAFNGLACDICNMTVSLTPDDTKNRLSLLYRNRFATKTFSSLTYLAQPNVTGNRHSGVILLPEMESQQHSETYSVMEIRGVYYFSNRLRIIGSLPVIRNERIINDQRQFVISGVGDPFVLAKYNLIRTNKIEGNEVNHRLTIGAGIKVPLGKFDFKQKGALVQHDIQAGTGTLDFLLALDYTAKYKNGGVMFSSNYKLNTYNKKVDYMFGNTANTTLNVFYSKKIKKVTLMPYIGSYVEHGNTDIEHGMYEENTGGSLLFGTVGKQLFLNNIQLELLYQHTLINKLNGTLQLDTRNRVQLGVHYLFNRKE